MANGVFVPAVIYSTAKWWNRRSGTKPAMFVRMVTHLLVLAIALPWFFLGTFNLIARPTTSEYVLWFLLEPLALLFLAFLAIGGILRAQGWDRHCIVRVLLAGVFLTAFLIWLKWDPPQPTPRYSWNDIPDPPDAARAREVLMRISQQPPSNMFPRVVGESPVVADLRGRALMATSAEILSNSVAIETAWNGYAEYRAVIAQLDTFSALPELGRSFRGPMLNYLELRKAAQLISLYARMKACQGDAGSGVSNLIQFYSVVRKALPHSSMLVSKMIWIACVGLCNGTASQIAQLPETKPETLQELADVFTPLRTEEATLKSAFIGEMCAFSEALSTTPPTDIISSEIWPDNRRLPRLAYFFMYNQNATLREYLAVMERMADYTSTLPGGDANSESEITTFIEKYYQVKHLKNLLGHHLAIEGIPNFIEAARKGAKRKVQSDLLALYLHQRLGTPLALNDIYTGAPYLTDEKTGLPFSAGPDGTPGTEDDVTLAK